MREDELKRCPFCGGIAKFERDGTHRQSCIVACGDCGATVESGEVGELRGRKWNTRAPDPITLKEIERLTNVAESESEHRRIAMDALRRKDEAMGVVIGRAQAAGVDFSDLIP